VHLETPGYEGTSRCGPEEYDVVARVWRRVEIMLDLLRIKSYFSTPPPISVLTDNSRPWPSIASTFRESVPANVRSAAAD
jgi:hypothetical protein